MPADGITWVITAALIPRAVAAAHARVLALPSLQAASLHRVCSPAPLRCRYLLEFATIGQPNNRTAETRAHSECSQATARAACHQRLARAFLMRTALITGCFSCCIPAPFLSALKVATSVCPRQCPRWSFATRSKAMSKSADVYGSSCTTSTLYFVPLTRYTTHLVNANNRPPRVPIIVAQ